jgi:hypothetical protein
MAKSRLVTVSKSILKDPLRIIVCGPEGIGKSSLAADAEQPVFFDVEDGTGRIGVIRYPFHEGVGGHKPQKYSDVLKAIEDLHANEHDAKTLVIDTADRLEPLLWQHCCERDGYANIEAYGYGRGYVATKEEWRLLCYELDELRIKRGMTIVLVCHVSIATFRNPLGDDFDRYQLRLHKHAVEYLKGWADIVGFFAFEESSSKLSDTDARAKGYSTGRRLLHTERAASYDAKTRIPLPSEIEIPEANPWAPLAAAISEGRDLDAAKLGELIRLEMAKIEDPALRKKIQASVKKAGDDSVVLNHYLNKLRANKEGQQ